MRPMMGVSACLRSRVSRPSTVTFWGSIATAQVGSSWAVAVDPQNVTVDGLEERLRKESDIPIIGRIVKDRYLLDTRTLWEEDFDYIAQAVKEADQ